MLKMKRKILSVLGVLMAVILSTAAFSACSKTPAGAENSGGSGESVSENNYDMDRINELIHMAFSVNGMQISNNTNFCFESPDDIKPEGFFNCFYSFADPEKFYRKTSEHFVFTVDDIQNFINENFYNASFVPDDIESLWDTYQPESDGYTYIKSGFCGLDSIKSNITILKITENDSEMKITFCLDSFDHSSLSAQTQYILTVYKNEGNDLIYSLVYGD